MIILIKPTYDCNFRCKYCYLNNSTKSVHKFIDVDFVQEIITQIKENLLQKKQKLTFIWHGGEPLLWGVENYRKVFSFMETELSGIDYKNSLQTNLSLINEEYIELFKRYNVHVGFSLDGPKDIHDSQRIFANGKGTFDIIMEKVRLCRNAGISIGCIVVGSKKHIGKIPQLYDFMGNNDMHFRFNPLFNSGEATNCGDNYSISADDYAKMMIELFDLWYYDEVNHIKESNLEEMASSIISRVTSHCMFGRNCQDNFFAIAPTGDVFPCGRFCDTDTTYAYGNLHEERLSDILLKIKQSDVYKRSEYIENSGCKRCKYFDICHGGCLHDGFLNSGDFKAKTFLCSAYKRIFSHIENGLHSTLKLNKYKI